ncbi:sulfotransferase [Thiocapsa roseopersicina]|uniref:Sulfotransferase family protein n=1 Tax=Thiocapsa roseopersicina TaxID=1058 RepID=A0A1H2Y442_THIRO|nr:sulfotransferase [Thiocapsa roseopersicina]SDW99896.1 Sulfotransferase family protein [Thiocapsa roseopersicina]
MDPNFLIIGALKAGTTSLAEWLRNHPEVYLPELKESRFFAYDASDRDHRQSSKSIYPIREWSEYRALFKNSADRVAIGEASPQYLYSQHACESIRERLPNVKLVVILRHPVRRAYSQYWMRVRAGKQSTPFESAVISGEGWVSCSMYHDYLKRYIDTFGRDRLCVLLFEDLISDPTRELNCLCGFLGIDPDRQNNELPRENAGRVGASALLVRLTENRALRLALRSFIPVSVRRGIRSRLPQGSPIPTLDPETLAKLEEFFQGDVARTSALVDKDLEKVWGIHAGAEL